MQHPWFNGKNDEWNSVRHKYHLVSVYVFTAIRETFRSAIWVSRCGQYIRDPSWTPNPMVYERIRVPASFRHAVTMYQTPRFNADGVVVRLLHIKCTVPRIESSDGLEPLCFHINFTDLLLNRATMEEKKRSSMHQSCVIMMEQRVTNSKVLWLSSLFWPSSRLTYRGMLDWQSPRHAHCRSNTVQNSITE